METVWFVLWGLLWAIYLVLDGFDLGLGSLLPFVARSDHARRVVFNAMGPFWDGNEVWLITAGGVTFAAFPRAYAVMFSALYTPLMLLLFALILRGVAFELRSKDDHPLWRRVWDLCLTVGSFLPALLLGVFFANLFAGIPIDSAGVLRGDLIDLLHPYALLGGALFVLLFLEHGALWLGLKGEGELGERGLAVARRLWLPLVVAVLGFLATSVGATRLWANYLVWPALFVLPAGAALGLAGLGLFLARGELLRAFFASSATIFCTAGFGVAGLYPALLPSNLSRGWDVTAFNSAASPLTLRIMLGVVLVVIPVVIGYQVWVYRLFRGKVRPEEMPY